MVHRDYVEQGFPFFLTLVLDNHPLPDVHLTNVAVQKTSPDYHPKKVRKFGFCPLGIVSGTGLGGEVEC